jgi:hypothetical protein
MDVVVASRPGNGRGTEATANALAGNGGAGENVEGHCNGVEMMVKLHAE